MKAVPNGTDFLNALFLIWFLLYLSAQLPLVTVVAILTSFDRASFLVWFNGLAFGNAVESFHLSGEKRIR